MASVRLIQREAGGAEGDEGGHGIGLRFEDGFEGGDGFALVAGHVLGQAEVEQQSGVGGLGLDELLVEGDGLLETAGGHQLVGLRQLLRGGCRAGLGGTARLKERGRAAWLPAR